MIDYFNDNIGFGDYAASFSGNLFSYRGYFADNKDYTDGSGYGEGSGDGNGDGSGYSDSVGSGSFNGSGRGDC